MKLNKIFVAFILLIIVLPGYYNGAYGQEIDILLKGGQLIDPKNKIDVIYGWTEFPASGWLYFKIRSNYSG